MAKTEDWWTTGLQKGWHNPEDYIQEIDDAVPAMADAMRNGNFGVEFRRGLIAERFERQMAHLTASMRRKESKCGQNDRVAAEGAERKRRDAQERAQVGTFDSIEKDFSIVWFIWQNGQEIQCKQIVQL